MGEAGEGRTASYGGERFQDLYRSTPVEAGIESRIPGLATRTETNHVGGRMNGKFAQRTKSIIKVSR